MIDFNRRSSLALAPLIGAVSSGGWSAQPDLLAKPVSLDGVIHPDSDDTLSFTPKEDVTFFDRSEGARKTIVISTRVDGRWTSPRVAGFSGQWFDQIP